MARKELSALNRDAPAAETAATSADELDPAIVRDVELVVDGGPAPLAQASTIVDCTGPAPRVLRAGAIDPALVLAVAAGE